MTFDEIPWRPGSDKVIDDEPAPTNAHFDWVHMYDRNGQIHTVIKRKDDHFFAAWEGAIVYAIDKGNKRAGNRKCLWSMSSADNPTVLDLMCAIDYFKLTLEVTPCGYGKRKRSKQARPPRKNSSAT